MYWHDVVGWRWVEKIPGQCFAITLTSHSVQAQIFHWSCWVIGPSTLSLPVHHRLCLAQIVSGRRYCVWWTRSAIRLYSAGHYLPILSIYTSRKCLVSQTRFETLLCSKLHECFSLTWEVDWFFFMSRGSGEERKTVCRLWSFSHVPYNYRMISTAEMLHVHLSLQREVELHFLQLYCYLVWPRQSFALKDSWRKRWYFWGASTKLLDKASHLTTFCSSPHLSATPAQLMRPCIDWNMSCPVGDFA